MLGMFSDAAAFNQDIGGWDVSAVTDMVFMFTNATSFNQDIGGWDVSNVKRMDEMFEGAEAFNQNINEWKIDSAKSMGNMFAFTGAFNQPLDKWKVDSVKNMQSMFYQAEAFNQDIRGWNVSAVADMFNMFYGASAFSHDLQDWAGRLKHDVVKGNVFKESGVTSPPFWYRLEGVPGNVAVTAVEGSTTELEVTWTAPPNGNNETITGYQIFYRIKNEENPAKFEELKVSGATALSGTLTGLNLGGTTTYEVKVAAYREREAAEDEFSISSKVAKYPPDDE